MSFDAFKRFMDELKWYFTPFTNHRAVVELADGEVCDIPRDTDEVFPTVHQCRVFTISTTRHDDEAFVGMTKGFGPSIEVRHKAVSFTSNGDEPDVVAFRQTAALISTHYKSSGGTNDELFRFVNFDLKTPSFGMFQDAAKRTPDSMAAVCAQFFESQKCRFETVEEARERTSRNIPVALACRIAAIELMLAPLRALRREMCETPQIYELMAKLLREPLYNLDDEQFEAKAALAKELEEYIMEWVSCRDFEAAKEHFEDGQSAESDHDKNKKRRIEE